jgi:hypothetical protein
MLTLGETKTSRAMAILTLSGTWAIIPRSKATICRVGHGPAAAKK